MIAKSRSRMSSLSRTVRNRGMGFREETYPVIPQPLAYPDMLERGSPKMNGDIRSENGLGSMGLEVTSAQGEGEGKEEANIRWVDREEMAAKLWSGISSLSRTVRNGGKGVERKRYTR